MTRSITQLCRNHGARHYYVERGMVGVPAGATIQWYAVRANGFEKHHRTITPEGATTKRV